MAIGAYNRLTGNGTKRLVTANVKTRVAVVQLDFHPAALVQRRSPIEDPLFQQGIDSVLEPASGTIPLGLENRQRAVRERVRNVYCEQLWMRVRAIVQACAEWRVRVLVFPEYSIPLSLLERLATEPGAETMVIVAGTHTVPAPRLQSEVYQRLQTPDEHLPKPGMAVCPVLLAGRIIGLQAKLKPAKPEQGSLTSGDSWQAIDLGTCDATLPGPMGVMICLDFLHRDHEQHRQLVGPGLDGCRFVAVPSLTPHYTVDEFEAVSRREALRYKRPVLYCDIADGGGTTIYVDAIRRRQNHQQFPDTVGCLPRGDEGVIVADIDLGLRPPGQATPYDYDEIVRPFAAASLVYPCDPAMAEYANWLSALDMVLAGSASGAEALEAAAACVVDSGALLERVARMDGSKIRKHRLARLQRELDHVTDTEDIRRFTREVVVPSEALPLPWLRAAMAGGAADDVNRWFTEHRSDEQLFEMWKRLDESSRRWLDKVEELTEHGRTALAEVRTCVGGQTADADTEAEADEDSDSDSHSECASVEHAQSIPMQSSKPLRVLVLATERDLGTIRTRVVDHLCVTLGVEAEGGDATFHADLGTYDHVVLLQGWWWNRGQVAAIWQRASVERRTLMMVDEEADWPPRRLLERSADAEIEAFRAGLSEYALFQTPDELPGLVCERISRIVGTKASYQQDMDRAPSEPRQLKERMPACYAWVERIKQSPLLRGRSEELDVAHSIVVHCYDIWEQARRNQLVGDDPWLDEHYAVRVLERLEAWLGPSPDIVCTLLLVTAPFVQQALVAGAVHAFATGAQPAELAYSASSDEPRNTLEQVHRNHPNVIRRTRMLRGDDRVAAVTWLVHRAIAHVPELWAEEPKLPLAIELKKRLVQCLRQRETLTWFDIVEFARCITLDPSSLESYKATDARKLVLTEILHIAARAALDPCDIDEVAILQLGADEEIHVSRIVGRLDQAQWRTHAGMQVLSCQCDHPVSDWVLRTLVGIADQRLQRLHEHRGGTASVTDLLDRLPHRLSPDAVEPSSDEQGRRSYRLPHVRFVLEHDRIRELLMGERIYNAPVLAIREMYQNALDACRYRKAREEFLGRQGTWGRTAYHGRIEFKQDVDDEGRPYIECRDNGVGMGEHEIAHVFAVAGQRFVETNEFLSERVVWRRCKPPIELHHNSQFGIGVLSYFLLADDVVLRTRRFLRDGGLGQGIEVRISGVSGMFHMRDLEDTEMPEAGTEVRLYLHEGVDVDERARQQTTESVVAEFTNEYDYEKRDARISCYKLLSTLLWFAEFETVVEEPFYGSLCWPAGELAPGGERGDIREYCRSSNPNIWWHFRTEHYDGNYILLADGIRTHSPQWYEDYRGDARASVFCIINLHGSNFPKLSLDRMRILEWNEKKFTNLIGEQAASLASWPGLSLDYLWAFTRELDDMLAHRVVELLYRDDFQIAVDAMLSRGDAPKVSINDIGVYPLDRVLISGLDEHLFYEDFEGKMPAVEAWRRQLLSQHAEIFDISSKPGNERPFVRMDEMAKVRLDPLDARLLTYNRPISVADLALLARKSERSYSHWLERVRELKPLGIRIDRRCRQPDDSTVAGLSPDELALFQEITNFRGNHKWTSRTPVLLIWNLSHSLNQKPSEIAQNLTALAPYLGLIIPHYDDSLDDLDVNAVPRWLHSSLSYTRYNSGSRFPVAQIYQLARQNGTQPSEIVAGISAIVEPFQLTLGLPCSTQLLDDNELTDDELELIWHADPRSGQIPVFAVIQTLLSKLSLGDASSTDDLLRKIFVENNIFSIVDIKVIKQVYDRIRGLHYLGIRLPSLDEESLLNTLLQLPEALDLRLKDLIPISKIMELGALFVEYHRSSAGITIGKMLELARSVDRPFAKLAEVLETVGLIEKKLSQALQEIDVTAGPYPECNSDMIECIRRAQEFGSEYIDEEIEAEARGHLYWLSDEQIAAQLTELSPLIEYARERANGDESSEVWQLFGLPPEGSGWGAF